MPRGRHARVLRSGRTVVCKRVRWAGEAKPAEWCLWYCEELKAVFEAEAKEKPAVGATGKNKKLNG